MNTTTALSTLLLLAGALPAQQGTSPVGLLNQEGNAGYTTLFGYYGAGSTTNTYYTMLDGTNAGTPRNLTALSWRRDGGTPTSSAYVARTVTMAIRMAHANFALVANNASNSEATLRTSPWITVFSPKAVNLPAMTQQPAGVAPFQVQFPLDVVFPYSGQGALLYQFKCSPSTLASGSVAYPLDAFDEISHTEGATTAVGTGCQVAGQPAPVRHQSLLWNFGPLGNAYWQLVTDHGPASSPALVVVGRSNPNLNVGGCAPLLAEPNLLLSAGTTSSSGWLNYILSFPHEPQFVGATLFTQSLVWDPQQAGLQLAFSNGARATYPANPVPGLPVAAGILWTSGSAFPNTFQLYKGDALVIGLSW